MSKFAVPCEIEIASEWWKNRIGYYSNNSDLDAEKLEQFKSNLIELLTKKYQGHWHVHQPLLGSGYRCVNYIHQILYQLTYLIYFLSLDLSYLMRLVVIMFYQKLLEDLKFQILNLVFLLKVSSCG